MRPFFKNLNCCPIENEWEIWLIKIDFGQPNIEVGQKMANGRLLFLALLVLCDCYHLRLHSAGLIGSSCVSIREFQLSLYFQV